MRSCFLTKSYRGGYIHVCYDDVLKTEIFTYQLPNDSTVYSAKSWGSAQKKIRESFT